MLHTTEVGGGLGLPDPTLGSDSPELPKDRGRGRRRRYRPERTSDPRGVRESTKIGLSYPSSLKLT